MKRRLHKLLALICISFLIAGCARQPVSSGITGMDAGNEILKQATITGTLCDESGAALIGQVVFYGNEAPIRTQSDILGRFSVEVPLGEYSVEVTKGSEYERKSLTVSVPDRTAQYLDGITLKRLYDTGWLAGDLHQHSIYSFDGSDAPSDILFSDLAAGMGFGAITDHNDIRSCTEFINAGVEGFIPLKGEEVTTTRGHYNAYGVKELIDPDVSNGKADIQRIADAVNAVPGAIIQVNHPTRNDDFMFHDWDIIQSFDSIEIWNGKDLPPYVAGGSNAQAVQKWFELLNKGIYLPGTANSDNHDIGGNRMFADEEYKTEDEKYFNQSMFSGMPRNYVRTETSDAAGVLGAITAGHSFLTNNPLAFLEIDGAGAGDTAAPGNKTIHVLAQSNRFLSSLALIVNGQILEQKNVEGNTAEWSVPAEFSAGDWILLEVRGEQGDFAITNPIFIQ